MTDYYISMKPVRKRGKVIKKGKPLGLPPSPESTIKEIQDKQDSKGLDPTAIFFMEQINEDRKIFKEIILKNQEASPPPESERIKTLGFMRQIWDPRTIMGKIFWTLLGLAIIYKFLMGDIPLI